MDRETRRAALSVAAKVALSMTLLGCEHAATPGHAEVADPGGGAGDHGSGAVDHGGGAAKKADPSCKTPPPNTAVDPAVFTCCIDYLAPYAPDGGHELTAPASKLPEVKACCAAVIDAVTQHTENYSRVPPGEKNGCCTLLDHPPTLLCTPWGPPVPPAMPEALREVWEAAA
jgi:hypothetical protein